MINPREAVEKMKRRFFTTSDNLLWIVGVVLQIIGWSFVGLWFIHPVRFDADNAIGAAANAAEATSRVLVGGVCVISGFLIFIIRHVAQAASLRDGR